MSQNNHPRNQLDQVICQLRYPALLSVDRNIDLFQERVRDTYPKYSPEPIVPLGVANPPGAGHIFTSSDGMWSVNVSTGAVSLTSRKYLDWNDFESKFIQVFEPFTSVFGIEKFNRIGLRYINAIRPSVVEMRMDSKVILKGPLADLFSSSTGSFRGGSCVLDRDLGNGISSRTVVGTIVFNDNESGFAIDNDVFTVEETDGSAVVSALRQFNEMSNLLFSEVASDELCKKVGLND